MSAGNSPQRARMLEALGAEVVLVPQVDGAPGQVTGADVAAAAYEAQCLVLKRGGFYVNQLLQKVCERIMRRLAPRYGSNLAGGSMRGWLPWGQGQPSSGLRPRCERAIPASCVRLSSDGLSAPRRSACG